MLSKNASIKTHTDKVTLGRVINCGRYGTVYHASGFLRGQAADFAVKILPIRRHDVQHDANMNNIRNEVVNMWRCRGHANVVRLHDVYKDNDNYYLVEEYCGGDTLQTTLGTENSESYVLQTIRDVAKALAHVHSKGILFLDVKPQNIVRSTTDVAFKLTDFGSSRKSVNGAVHHSQVLCTPLFASPELIMQQSDICFSHDSWALGILMFWMAAGRHPFLEFDTGTPHDLLKRIVQVATPMHDLPPGMLRELASLLLNKDPSKRLSSAQLVQIIGL